MAGPLAHRDPRHKDELATITQVFRDFEGINVQSPRQSIRDNQFSWIENLIPIAPGNLAVTNNPSLLPVAPALTHVVQYTMTANIAGTDYLFVFETDGSAYYINNDTYVSTSLAPAGSFTTPFAVGYEDPNTFNQGILIIDPTKGYFDFSVTTAFILTALSNRLQSITVTVPGTYTGVPSTVNIIGGGGTGATAEARLGVRSATVSAAGTGYVVGDILTIPFVVFAPVPTTFTVTAVNGTGGVTGFTISNGGQGYNPQSPMPATSTGGAGTGATFNCTYGISAVIVLHQGQNYTSNPFISFSGGVGGGGAANATVTGGLTGSLIAVYAGRVWIASKRSISYSDVFSYTSFAGAGGQLTITDSYLHQNITALYATNGYLYIFGDDSIDTLSNVQVNPTTGVTGFSRTNITSSIGTSYPQSVVPFYRSLMFANNYGIFSLSGATPQKVSDDLDGFFQPARLVGGLIAGACTIFGELCVAWTLRIVDQYTTLYGLNVTRTLVMVFYRGKWFVTYPGFDVGQMVSVPEGGNQVIHAWTTTAAPTAYALFADATVQPNISFWQTKLWDGGVPIQDKEVIRVGVGMLFPDAGRAAPVITTDNENNSEPTPLLGELGNTINFIANAGPIQEQNNSLRNIYFYVGAQPYSFLMGTGTTNGGKYYGVSCKAQLTGLVFSFIAIEYRSTRIW